MLIQNCGWHPFPTSLHKLSRDSTDEMGAFSVSLSRLLDVSPKKQIRAPGQDQLFKQGEAIFYIELNYIYIL